MNSVSSWVVVGSLALLSFGTGCGGDDDGGGSGGSGTGGAGAGGGGTGGSGIGGTAGSASGGAAGSGTGGSSTGGTGGGSGTHKTCTDAAAKLKAMAAKVGCTDNSVTVQAACEGFYSANTCVTEWEAVLACALALPDSAWECNGKQEPDFKTGNCTAQKAAFDTCIGN